MKRKNSSIFEPTNEYIMWRLWHEDVGVHCERSAGPIGALSPPLSSDWGKHLTWQEVRTWHQQRITSPSSLAAHLLYICRYWGRQEQSSVAHLSQEKQCGCSCWPAYFTAPPPTMWIWRNWTVSPKRRWRYGKPSFNSCSLNDVIVLDCSLRWNSVETSVI